MACKCWIRSKILRFYPNQNKIRKRNRNLRQTMTEKSISLCRFFRICISLKSLHQSRSSRYKKLCRQLKPKLKNTKLLSKKPWRTSIQNKLSRTSKRKREKKRRRELKNKRRTKSKKTANKAEELLEWKSSQSFKKLLRFYFLIFIF